MLNNLRQESVRGVPFDKASLLELSFFASPIPYPQPALNHHVLGRMLQLATPSNDTLIAP
jgi:hypothetical protein